MNSPFIAQNLTKEFDGRIALQSLSLEIPAGRVAGLLGRNGSGKTTLLNLASGLLLPTHGACITLGRTSGELDTPELSRLGVVAQEGRFLEWMTVAQHLHFQGSFYARWDKARETRLLQELELDSSRKISQLSVGDQQKLGIILGVCHHPSLLLLDEPMSALDPIARTQLLSFLIDVVREDETTIIISSHFLADVEKIMDWIVCLDRGELAASTAFDDLQESYSEWTVTSTHGSLPAKFVEPWVLSHTADHQRARLLVRPPGADAIAQFSDHHHVRIESRTLNLEQLFPLLIKERSRAA